MDINLAHTILSRLNHDAFVEFFNFRHPKMSPLEGFEDAFVNTNYSPQTEKNTHHVDLIHHLSIPQNDIIIQYGPDPVLTERLRRIIELYSRKTGEKFTASGYVDVGQLQCLGFISNHYGYDQKFYDRFIVPAYWELAQRLGYDGGTRLFSSIDYMVGPEHIRDELSDFLLTNRDGLSITIGDEGVKAEQFRYERPFTTGMLPTGHLCEPVFTGAIHPGGKDLVMDFEELLRREPLESELEDFLVANYKSVFGFKYDSISTQLWLKFPELDLAGKSRRLDVFLRNSIEEDWELFEIKRATKLTSTYRDVPTLSHEVHGALAQLRNYGRLLSQDKVKRRLAEDGIEYYSPSLRLVIGRTPAIPRQQWRFLKTSASDIKLITYDDLLREMAIRLDSNDTFLPTDDT